MSNGNKTSTLRAIVTLIGISAATVSGVIIPIAIWFHGTMSDMRKEDIGRFEHQFTRIDIALEATRKEQMESTSRMASIEKSIEMILVTRKENLEEFKRRFDKIDAALLRMEAKIVKQ